jgi:hypothetical protein
LRAARNKSRDGIGIQIMNHQFKAIAQHRPRKLTAHRSQTYKSNLHETLLFSQIFRAIYDTSAPNATPAIFVFQISPLEASDMLSKTPNPTAMLRPFHIH